MFPAFFSRTRVHCRSPWKAPEDERNQLPAAEGYAAGEMKHGPIALIDEKMLVIGLVPADEMRHKMFSNLQEVRARDGKSW
jgi:hypothetical protein